MTTWEHTLNGLIVLGGAVLLIWFVVVAFRKEEGESRFAAIGRGLWAIIVVIIVASLIYVLFYRLSG